MIQRGLVYLNAELDKATAFAQAQQALNTLYQSIGLNGLPDRVGELGLNELAQFVRKHLAAAQPDQFDSQINVAYAELQERLAGRAPEPLTQIIHTSLRSRATYRQEIDPEVDVLGVTIPEELEIDQARQMTAKGEHEQLAQVVRDAKASRVSAKQVTRQVGFKRPGVIQTAAKTPAKITATAQRSSKEAWLAAAKSSTKESHIVAQNKPAKKPKFIPSRVGILSTADSAKSSVKKSFSKLSALTQERLASLQRRSADENEDLTEASKQQLEQMRKAHS